MNRLSAYWLILTHLGPAWVWSRLGYAARRKSGLLRRATPAVSWDAMPAPALRLHPHAVAGLLPERWGTACTHEADDILRGEFRLFSHRLVAAGFPPDWCRNQITGERATQDRHWTELGDFGFGDIKGVWELSRFPWAFTLARTFARTRDPRYADAFWQLFADWCRCNPPNIGPNWMCGQEATFRLMAVVFAAEVMGVPANERLGLACFFIATGRRVAVNLGYALSQKNNHGVSECIGLITVALSVPEHIESPNWLARGLRELEAQLNELVYEDGGFAQHALIYHRVLLHDLCWCRSRLVSAEQAIPAWLDAAGRRALDFMMALVDPATGQAPLYGANDGSNVLPLADADFLDMRPAVQAAAAVFRAELPVPEGPWDEAASWLVADWTGLKRMPWPKVPARWYAHTGGCFQMTSGRSRLFFRCPEEFRHRPCQADMLHVDVWHDGRPIAHDGGTFSYNSPERFTALNSAACHNVLTVDGREPLQKFSRFLYLPWPKGAAFDSGTEFSASHNGYAKLGVDWMRTVSSTRDGGFEVKDSIKSRAPHRYRLHWRLCDREWQLATDNASISTSVEGTPYTIRWQSAGSPIRVRLVRADSASADGWWSPHYSAVEPAVSFVIEFEARGNLEVLTVFGGTGSLGELPKASSN